MAADDELALHGRTLREHTARGTLINSGFQIGLAGLGLLRRFLVAGFLSRGDFGLWTILVTTLITLSWLKQVGLQDKYIQQREPDQERAFQKAFTLELALSLAFFVLICALLPVYGVGYGHTEIIVPGIVLALSVPLTAFQSPLWIFYRRMDFVRQRAIAAVDPVVALVVTLALAIAGFDYWSLVIGTVAGSLCGSVLAVAMSPYRPALRYDRGTVREYASFSWPLVGFGVSNLLIVQGTLLVGTKVVGLAGIGAVGLAGTISQFADRVDGIVSTTIYPAVCRVADKRATLFEAFVKSNRLALIWGMPFGVGLALFASDLVTFGFGEKWRSAAAIIAAYGLIAAFRQVGFNYSIFQRAVNDTRPMFISAVINLLAFALVGVPCILIFGLAGFPIGFGAMTAIQIGVRGYFMSKLFAGFQMWRHLLRAMAPSVPAAAVVLLARAIAPGERSLAHALFELALYIVATLAATAFFERRLMREMTSYVTGRRSGRDLLTGDDGELLDGGGGAEPGTAASAEAPRRRDPMLKWVGCAVAVAFVLRLGMVGVATDWPVVFDPADYARHALAIAHTGHYPDTSVAPGGGPTALRPPAWPYALGAVFAVTGDNVGAARVLQAGLGTAAVALMALIAWQLFGPRASLFAAIVGAVYPPWLLLDASLFSEPLFMVFELGAVAAVLHARGSPRRWAWLALTGVLLGLAVLTRSNGVLLALPLALLAWPGRREGSWRALAAPALIVLCAALTVAPWTVRNAVVMNAFVPVSTQSGYTLAGAYNDASRNDRREPATWRVATADPAYARLLAGSPREVELNGRLGSRAKSYISDHPGYVAKVLFWNVRRFLHLGRFEFARHSYSAYGASRTAADIAIFSFYPVLLLALAGLVLPASRRAPLALWLVPLLMCTPLFIEANIRFRAPVEPFVLMLAGIALAAASQRTARFRRLATLRSGGSPEAVRAGPT